jgi:putative peptidoglycan lipid II flippase
MYPLKHNGIALAGSISAAVNVLILAFVLRNKIGSFLDRAFYISFFKIILSSVVMLGAIGIIEYFMPWNTHAGLQSRLIFLTSSVFAGACVFFISAYLLKSQEIYALINMVKKRLNRP